MPIDPCTLTDYDIHLRALDLPNRTYNTFMRNEVQTIGQMIDVFKLKPEYYVVNILARHVEQSILEGADCLQQHDYAISESEIQLVLKWSKTWQENISVLELDSQVVTLLSQHEWYSDLRRIGYLIKIIRSSPATLTKVQNPLTKDMLYEIIGQLCDKNFLIDGLEPRLRQAVKTHA